MPRVLKAGKSLLFGAVIACAMGCIGMTITGFSGKGRAADARPVIGTTVADFALRNVDGNTVSLKDFPDAKGFIVVFTCNHCPFAKLYPARMNALNAKFGPLHVPLIAINSMDTQTYQDENLEMMAKKAKAEQFTFPYLRDAMQTVGKEFNADHTPHAFVIWKEQNAWTIRYSGAIDDNGAAPEKVQHAFVANAVEELLEGKPVSKPLCRSIGCAIMYRQ